MKFYIATSNLNLDNILQSECILPPIHYSRRCSGYKTYEQLDELRFIESIVLFKYPVRFNINDMGRYNFPMLIEFEDDSQTCDFSDKEIQEYKQSVINKLFAILGIFEDCEAINDYSGYTAYIKRLTREFNGLYNMFGIVNFLSVVSILEGSQVPIEHSEVKRIVFHCISLVKKAR